MARVRELAGLRIEQHSSPNVGGSMSAHRGVVLHIAQGYYQGTIHWQLNPNQRYEDGTEVTTSSTWIVGRARGEWAQMVDSDRVAWAQRDGSRTWLSIELAGFAPAAPSAWQVEACAQLLAWSARTHGHPIAIADHPGQRGLGHHAMDREWRGEEWGHDQCPGSGVIGAKAAIVARAREIEEGEMVTDDDVKKIATGVRGIMVRLPDGRERSLEWTLRWCYGHITGAKKLIKAQQPLLEAAAQGQALSGEQVQQVAAQVAEAVGDGLADEVADELAERLAGGESEGT